MAMTSYSLGFISISDLESESCGRRFSGGAAAGPVSGYGRQFTLDLLLNGTDARSIAKSAVDSAAEQFIWLKNPRLQATLGQIGNSMSRQTP